MPVAKKDTLTVVAAVKRDLAALAKRDKALAAGSLAAAALQLAREIDSPGNSSTSKSMCAKELRETMAALHALAPAEEVPDRIDDLQQRRAKRMSASQGS